MNSKTSLLLPSLQLPSLLLLAALSTIAARPSASAQTTTAPRSTTAPRKATTHAAAPRTPSRTPSKPIAATPASNPKDAPPNVPKIEGTPKPLYALRYVDTVIGTGALAEPRKYYTVHYTGWLTDGTKFDSSVDRGAPYTFPYGAHQVIPGWDTGFENMHVGGKRRLFVPYQLAYGDAGRPPVIPAKSDLIFDLELISISDTPPAPLTPPTAPADPAKPTAEPTKTTPPPTSPDTQTAKPSTDPTQPTAQPATKPETRPQPKP